MRPSTETGTVVILDTLPECKVVLDALEDRDFYTGDVTSAEDFMNSIGVRFRSQTQYEPRPPAADAYVELRWKPSPEFRVEEQDVDVLSRAARRTLEQRQLNERLFNKVTHRTKAAQAIIAFLDDTSI